jgi:hypothetical protein
MMSEVKKLIDELGIISFENNMRIAGFAVLSDSRDIVYQTENWDVSKYRDLLFNAINGAISIEINNTEFFVSKASDEGVIATSAHGMGYIIMIPFNGGVLATYALSGADTRSIITFLKPHIMDLQNIFV